MASAARHRTARRSIRARGATRVVVVCQRRGGVHLFSAAVEREVFVAGQLQMLADSNFGGSLTPLLNTLIDNTKLSRKDREAIRKIIEKID